MSGKFGPTYTVSLNPNSLNPSTHNTNAHTHNPHELAVDSLSPTAIQANEQKTNSVSLFLFLKSRRMIDESFSP
jgi:hypothetical protein